MNDDPIAVDLNVDAALVLQDLVGIDSYPTVLALLPNIYRFEDRDRVHAVIATGLTESGILDDGRVHPTIEHWLHCLDRPDVELVARIVATDDENAAPTMLRCTLVRRADTHVLALRCDDRVVIQPVFTDGERTDAVSAALAAALGPATASDFEPLTALLDQFQSVPSDPEPRRRALLELGATAHTATVLTRALDSVVRRAEVVIIEHQDGSLETPDLCLSVLDTEFGRIAVLPTRALDGRVHSTYMPGDDMVLRAGIRALIELLPSRSWFDCART